MSKIVLRREAQNDLRLIDRFSIDRFGDHVAMSYMAALDAVMEQLGNYPESGQAYQGLNIPMRHLSCGSHRIFYQFDGRVVIVVRILHKSMNAAQHLQPNKV